MAAIARVPRRAAAREAASAHADWVAAMRAGDFDRAWAISDRDLAALCRSGQSKHEGPRHLQRIWRGEDLRGKTVLVRCYHGLGDTIQFIRFARPLRQIAHSVIVWCQPELVPLIARVEGVDRAMPLHDGAAQVSFDVDIEIMEIPHAIRAQRQQIEVSGPYLRLPPDRAQYVAHRNEALAIGLVWEAGDWDERRSIPPIELQRLGIAGVRLYSLQRGQAAKAAAALGAIDMSTAEFETLACRLHALDVVICPDTMIAHLSAALGCETWILLHSDCDWRWPSSGSTTFWYPSARLFHQTSAGDWGSVVDEVRRALLARMPGRDIPPHAGQAGLTASAAVNG